MQPRMAERKPGPRRPANRLRLLPRRRAEVRVHGRQREEPLAHDHGVRRDPAGGAEGVLLAHGSWFAGYSLYVQEAGCTTSTTTSGSPSTASARARTAARASDAALPLPQDRRAPGDRDALRERRQVGEGEIPHTIPAVIETSGEGLCCGYDSGLPVTDAYRRRSASPGHRAGRGRGGRRATGTGQGGGPSRGHDGPVSGRVTQASGAALSGRSTVPDQRRRAAPTAAFASQRGCRSRDCQ